MPDRLRRARPRYLEALEHKIQFLDCLPRCREPVSMLATLSVSLLQEGDLFPHVLFGLSRCVAAAADAFPVAQPVVVETCVSIAGA